MKEALATANPREQLRGLKRVDFFRKAWEIASQEVLDTPEYEGHMLIFGNEAIARRAILLHQFSDVTDPREYEALVGLGSKKQEIWRNITLDAIRQGDDLGFSPTELAVVESGLRIAGITDKVYMQWRSALIDSDLGKKFKEMGPEEAAKFLDENGINNRYTIPVLGKDGSWTQRPYAQAFPFEYSRIDEELRFLLARLINIQPDSETPALIKYFRAYREAMRNKNPQTLREKWKAVDSAWMDVKGPLQPVHAIERYMEPSLTRIDPEFKIILVEESRKKIDEKVEENRKAMMKKGDESFEELSTYQASRAMLEKAQVFVGSAIVMSGANIDFKIAGETGPDADVAFEKGCKIYIITETMIEREQVMRRLMEEVFGKEFSDLNFVDGDLEIFAGEYVAGHEIAHNFFYTKDTEEKLGQSTFTLLDETKADLAVLSVLRKNWLDRKVSETQMQRIVTCIMASAFRDLSYRGNEAHKPYYNCAVTEFNLLIDTGVLSLRRGKWAVNLDNLDLFLTQADEAFTDLAQIYQNYDRRKAERFIAEHTEENESILNLVAQVKQTQGAEFQPRLF